MLVRYVMAKVLREVKEMSYRAYVTDSLRLIPQMHYLTHKWSDIMDRARKPRQERTAEQIVEDVISKLGEVGE